MPNVDAHPPGTPCWLDLMTDAPEKSREFFAGLFGWTYEIGGPEMGFYAMARKNGRQVAGIGGKPPGAQFPNAWSVYFRVDDLDASLAKAKELGAQVTMDAMDIPEAGRMAMIADPTGAVVGLWQPKAHKGAQVIDEPGAMTWFEVNTRDHAKARDFYAKLFDLAPRKLEAPNMTYSTLHRGEKAHAGVLQMDEKWEGIPPHWMAYFAVADADAAAKKVAELGGSVRVPPFDTPYGRMLVIADPSGAHVSLVKPSQLATEQ